MFSESERGNYEFAVSTTGPTYPADLKGNSYLGIALVAATYTHATRSITLAAAFTGYTFADTDYVWFSGGTNVPVEWVQVASRISNNEITLAGNGLGALADGAVNVAGMLHKRGPFTPSWLPAGNYPAGAKHRCRSVILERIRPVTQSTAGAADVLTFVDVAGATLPGTGGQWLTSSAAVGASIPIRRFCEPGVAPGAKLSAAVGTWAVGWNWGME